MGWRPEPRWDRINRCWRVQLRGKMYGLGADRATAYRRFGELLEQTGTHRTGRHISSVPALVEEWQRLNPSPHYQRMAKDWLDFAGYTPLRLLPANHLLAFDQYLTRKGDLRKGCINNSPQTRRHKLSLAIRVLRYAMKQDWIETMPEIPALPAVVREPKDVDLAELGRIFQELDQPLRERAGRVFRFIVTTGCRPGEARNLMWSQIRFDVGRFGACRLLEHKSRHRGKSRTIYLNADARQVIREVSKCGDPCSGFVFLSRLGNPYTSAGLRSIIRRIGCTPYQLRHTFAQNMLDQGGSIDDLRKLIGHSQNSRVTEAYATIRDTRALEVAQSLVSPLRRVPRDRTSQGRRPKKTAKASAPASSPPKKRKPSAAPARRARRKGA